jgi:hypothetical protein
VTAAFADAKISGRGRDYRERPAVSERRTEMTKHYRILPGVLAITTLSRTTATAQDAAKPALPDSPSYISTILLLIPFVFLGLLVVMMRRTRGVKPMMDSSLLLAEESVRLAKEQIELQKETNRLLGQLIKARGWDPE